MEGSAEQPVRGSAIDKRSTGTCVTKEPPECDDIEEATVWDSSRSCDGPTIVAKVHAIGNRKDSIWERKLRAGPRGKWMRSDRIETVGGDTALVRSSRLN